ncbi:MAG: 4Fe-4S dicluster domain-containing protein [Eubacteriales bacterium]
MSIISFSRTVLQNLFSKPVTRNYPQVPREYPVRTRGQIGIDIDACIFCGICMKKCPTGAIAVVRETKNWSINRFGCIQCGECVGVCPKKCLTMLQAYAESNATKTRDSFTQAAKAAPAEPPKTAAPAAAAPETQKAAPAADTTKE